MGPARIREAPPPKRQRSNYGTRKGKRGDFQTSRLEEVHSDYSSIAASENDNQVTGDVDDQDTMDAVSSESDEEQALKDRPYSELLQILNSSERAPKKRKLDRKHHKAAKDESSTSEIVIEAKEQEVDNLAQQDTSDDDEPATRGYPGDLDDDIEDAHDPFELHFTHPEEDMLLRKIQAISKSKWRLLRKESFGEFRLLSYTPELDVSEITSLPSIKKISDLKLKERILATASMSIRSFNGPLEDLATSIFNYQDILCGIRTASNSSHLRNLVCLHLLNHVLKTRDRVLKNNTRAAKLPEGNFDFRDQGFTRPKVLLLLPTRQACVHYVESITKLYQPEQQENMKRFMDQFNQKDEQAWEKKPADFRELFGGNDDDMFRIGLKFTRKSIKFFSQFYNSDVILASPLGLRTIMDKEDERKQDSDFLSSIELAIIDQANGLLMQNWEHVEYIFGKLNLQPKEAHGCDFSRVRTWYLDNQAQYLRQTITFSSFITPELNSLFSAHMQNVYGKIKMMPQYNGAITEIALPVPVKQMFYRFDSPSPQKDPDVRFGYFTTVTVPILTRSVTGKGRGDGTGTLIFIPSYLDFVRVRNFFSTSLQTTNISFGTISEYSSVQEVARARSHFLTGRQAVLLYTERAHHFRRYRLRGVRRIIMYGVPENPIFWGEIVGFLGLDPARVVEAAEGGVKAAFSKWDALKIERIVGTSRMGNMMREKGGDTFTFV